MIEGWMVLLLAGGCNGSKEANTLVPEAEELVMTASDLRDEAVQTAVVPSPVEMQKALDGAGIEARLAELVQQRDLKMDVPNKDQVAVRTGVILADMLLTVGTAPKERLLAQIAQVREGMVALGGDHKIASALDDLAGRIRNDAVGGDELVRELDELTGTVIPDVRFEIGDRAVPLIQAGSWLEGANLVARALLDKGDFSHAGRLLRQPAVITYFLKYVRTEGQEIAGTDLTATLEQTLLALKKVAESETIGRAEVEIVRDRTAAVLDLL